MKYYLKMMSLSLMFTAPLAGALSAQTLTDQTNQTYQVVRRAERLAQNTNEALDVFFNSGYTYWDARVMANFWGQSVTDAKTGIGMKLMGGPLSKALLSINLTEAREKAIRNADSLDLYSVSGFSYDDAAEIAEFWGDASPYDGKIRIEKNLVLGNADALRSFLRLNGQ